MSNQELVRVEAPDSPRKLVELSSRKDAFMNRIRLLWSPDDGSVHLKISSTVDRAKVVDFEVPADKANDSFEHPYIYGLEAEQRIGKPIISTLFEVDPIPDAA